MLDAVMFAPSEEAKERPAILTIIPAIRFLGPGVAITSQLYW